MTATLTGTDWVDEFRSSCQKTKQNKKILSRVKQAGAFFFFLVMS